MQPNQAPAGATRITFEFWTTAPYTENERNSLRDELIEFVVGGDDDIVSDSFNLSFEDQKEIVANSRRALLNQLEEAEMVTEISIRFGEDLDDLLYKVGGDNEE